MTQRRSKAFTLIELLVVLAIISMLAALLFPALATARMQGASRCAPANMRQIDLAFLDVLRAITTKESGARKKPPPAVGPTDCIPSYVSWFGQPIITRPRSTPTLKNGRGWHVQYQRHRRTRAERLVDPSDPDPKSTPTSGVPFATTVW